MRNTALVFVFAAAALAQTVRQNTIEITPNTTDSATGEIRWLERRTNGSNYVGFKAADSLAANKVWKLPTADGIAGEFIKTDGSGNLSFADPACALCFIQLGNSFGVNATLGLNDDFALRFETNNTIRMTVFGTTVGAGAVSIGTVNPPLEGEQLRVDGSGGISINSRLRLRDGGGTATGWLRSHPSSAFLELGTDNATDLSLMTNSIERGRLMSTGLTLYGPLAAGRAAIVAPSYSLHAFGNWNAQDELIGLENAGGLWKLGVSTISPTGSFFIDNAGGRHVQVTTSGNVGLGTSTANPTRRLVVRLTNAIANDGIQIDTGSTSPFLLLQPRVNDNQHSSLTQVGDSQIVYGIGTGIDQGYFELVPWNSIGAGLRTDPRFVGNWKTTPTSTMWNAGTKVINGASNATPIQIDFTAAHNLAVGDYIGIINVGGNTAANGIRKVKTVVDADSIEIMDIDGVSVAGSGAYTSGGQAAPAYDGLRVVLNDYPMTEEHAGLGTGVMQALVGAINIPSGANLGGGTLGFGAGVSGYADSQSATGVPVGGRFHARNQANSSSSTGINPSCATYPGATSQTCFAIDANVDYKNSGDSVEGLRIFGSGPGGGVVPTSSIGVHVGYVDSANTKPFAYGFYSGDGQVTHILQAGTATGSNPSASADIQLRSRNSGGSVFTTLMYADGSHNLIIDANTTTGTYLNSLQLFMPTENAGLELGASTASNTPYIDFHTRNAANDYNVRLIASGGSGVGSGTLTSYGDLFVFIGGTNNHTDLVPYDNLYGKVGQASRKWSAGFFQDMTVDGVTSITRLDVSGSTVLTSGRVLQNIANLGTSLIPSADATYDLGSTTARINTVEASTHVARAGSGSSDFCQLTSGSVTCFLNSLGANTITLTRTTGNITGTGTIRADTGFSANGTAGTSATITVRDAAGTGTCTLVFTFGLRTGGTC